MSLHALEAYENLAPHYDAYSAGVNYAQWTDLILSSAERFARHEILDVLDVGAGTGSVALLLAERGLNVHAVDLSPAMVAAARSKAQTAGVDITLAVADMRSFRLHRHFDLVVCTDDALNYMDDCEELEQAFASVAAHLRPGGVFVFDMLMHKAFVDWYGGCEVVSADDVCFVRHSQTSAVPLGGLGRVAITTVSREDGGTWALKESIHCQRHFQLEIVRKCANGAGLEVMAELAPNDLSGTLDNGVDESKHHRAVFVAAVPA